MQETPIDISKLSDQARRDLAKKLAEATNEGAQEKITIPESVDSQVVKKEKFELPDSDGSPVVTSLSEVDITARTDKQIVDPSLLTADQSVSTEALQRHLEETTLIDSSGNPKMDLKAFLDNIQSGKN